MKPHDEGGRFRLRVEPETTRAEAKRKRSHETIRLPRVEPRHVLPMGNLTPGTEKANAASVAAAAAGQSHDSH